MDAGSVPRCRIFIRQTFVASRKSQVEKLERPSNPFNPRYTCKNDSWSASSASSWFRSMRMDKR